MKKIKRILHNPSGNNSAFFVSREAFLKGLLESASRLLAAERVSFYYHDEKNALLRLLMRRGGGVSFEVEEDARPVPDSPAGAALASQKPVSFSNRACYCLIVPFHVEIYSAGGDGRTPVRGVIRLERTLKKGRRFSAT